MRFALYVLLGISWSGAAAAETAPAPSAEQRAAAHRLLEATGATTRRNAQLDGIVDRVLIFSSPICASATNAQDMRACAAKTPGGRIIFDTLATRRSELVAAIADVQERAYASRLSVAEMDATASFASTPAGRRFFAEGQGAAIEAERAAAALVLSQLEAALATATPKADTTTDQQR